MNRVAAEVWAKIEAAQAGGPVAPPSPPPPPPSHQYPGETPAAKYWRTLSAEEAETYRRLWGAFPYQSKGDAHRLTVLAVLVEQDRFIRKLAAADNWPAARLAPHDPHRESTRVALSEMGIDPRPFLPDLPKPKVESKK